MKHKVLTIAVVALSVMMLPTLARAESAGASGQGIQISPVRIELNADAAKTYELKLNITNVTSGDLVLKPVVNDFRAKDELGTPALLLDGSNPSSYSLKSWVQPLPTFLLKSKESRVVPVIIKVPVGAEPGGHYGVVRYSGTPPNIEDSGVSLAASVGTLILTRVSGEVKENIQIADYFAMQRGKRSNWFEAQPITFVERLKNTGNVHVKPQGTIEVKDMFGRTAASLKVNDKGLRSVLPDSISRFEQQLTKPWMFGQYKADLNLVYGTTGGVVQSYLTFWVIPWRIILVGILIAVVIFFILRYAVRRYNKMVISRHKEQ